MATAENELQFKKDVSDEIKEYLYKISNGEIGELTFEDMVTIVATFRKSVVKMRTGWACSNGIFLYLRRQVIMQLLKRGMPRTEIIRYLIEKWNVSQDSIVDYLNDVYNYIKTTDEQLKEDVRLTTLEKLQSVVQECLERGKHKEALSAYDQINKINGLYSETKNVNVKDITFKFGGDE